uniref:Ammonium transporter n=1 Tax=Microbotryum violaceum TaxID=5272 RepID=Q9Y877_USTVI|nr:ammonium transporter MEPa [Microbotryum violaceum]
MVNVAYDTTGTLVANVDGTQTVYNGGDMAWVLVAGVLVMIMSPGVGFLYSGLLRRKNALSMMMLGVLVYAVITIQWFFWGYSLAFSSTGSAFIGDLKHFGLMNVTLEPSAGSSKIPALLYYFYQSMFATVTVVILVGGIAERARILPLLIFCFCWATIVYDPIANWVWNPNGWLYKLGELDFAGGGPVHITSGTAGFAWSLYLGRRRGYGTAKLAYRPHSVFQIILGTVFLWFGWFGFNGGSELAMNLRAVQASTVTNIAAAMGGITWFAMDWFYTKKWSAVSMCSGILAGLVGITPAAGYIGSPAALAIGFLTAIACNFGTGLKVLLGIDDAVDSFALHAIGGYCGSALTALFADSRVAGFDGYTEIPGGWINHNYIQLGWQLAGATTIMAYTFVVTYLLLFVIDHIPGLKLRATEDMEILGIDETELGENAYDFVFRNRDLENPEEFSELHNRATGEDLSRQVSHHSSSSHNKDIKSPHSAVPVTEEKLSV